MKSVAEQYLGYGKPSWLKFLLYPLYVKYAYLPRQARGGRLLDVGCGSGAMLHIFRDLGWKVMGVEIDKKAAEMARQRGFKVISDSFEQALLPNNTFDSVFMSHSFEHLRVPHFVLEKARQILKPGGELILILPNGRSLGARIFGKYWTGLDVPRHLFIYNKDNLNRLLLQHGIQCREVFYVSAFCGFLMAFAYKFKRGHNLLYRLETIPARLINFILDPLVQGLQLGDTMIIRARKKDE